MSLKLVPFESFKHNLCLLISETSNEVHKSFPVNKKQSYKKNLTFPGHKFKKDQNPSKSESHFLSVYQVICYNDDAFSSLAPLWCPLWDATPRAMPFSAKRQTFEITSNYLRPKLLFFQ